MLETNLDQGGLLNEIIDQAHNPPGGDPVLGAFYTATLQAIDGQQPFGKLVVRAKVNRPDITDKHFVNLLFRTFQFLRLGTGDLSYRAVEDVDWWSSELSGVASQNGQKGEFEDILKHRSTTTTIYQRYTGPYAIIAHFFDGKKVTVADLGCGGNYGLRGIDIGEKFQPIKDSTPNSTISKLLSQHINLTDGVSMDKDDPDIEETRLWRLACSFYPQELDQLPNIEEFEKRIKGSQRVRFVEADLLRYDGLRPIYSDVVILSTVLYQLHRAEQLKLLEQAKQFLNPNGILIVQDFAQKDPSHPTHLDFSESWFGREFTYRTFIASIQTNWRFLEGLRWDSGRCRTVGAGTDFAQIFNVT